MDLVGARLVGRDRLRADALGNFTVSGNPSIVQNSYRELLAGQ